MRPQRRAAALQQGFTLIEIMVVIVIMGILAALIVPRVIDRPDQARQVAAKQDIGSLMQALKLYRLDNGRFPATTEGLNALVQKPANATAWHPYLDKLPNDPWGHPYQYLNPGLKGEIDVFSFGPDGKAGGEHTDGYVGSWDL